MCPFLLLGGIPELGLTQLSARWRTDGSKPSPFLAPWTSLSGPGLRASGECTYTKETEGPFPGTLSEGRVCGISPQKSGETELYQGQEVE